jgi:hypothetical protein
MKLCFEVYGFVLVQTKLAVYDYHKQKSDVVVKDLR